MKGFTYSKRRPSHNNNPENYKFENAINHIFEPYFANKRKGMKRVPTFNKLVNKVKAITRARKIPHFLRSKN